MSSRPRRPAPILDAQLARFEREFPQGDLVRRLFAAAGSDPIFAAPAPGWLKAPPGSWALHVRLDPRLEDSYGFTRQFLVYCMPTNDLQSRAVTQIKRLIETAQHPIETDFAIVVTRDPGAKAKIEDWALERSEGLTVVVFGPDDVMKAAESTDPEFALSQILDRSLAVRNLYDERDPVRGERFFGRADLLRELDRLISHGQRHIGLFGLRRIGKTSVLLELSDRLKRRPDVIPIFLDLELSSAANSGAHVAHRIGQAVADVIASRTDLSPRGARRALGLPEEWESIPARTLILNLGERLAGALKGGALQDTRLALILDESEILLPSVSEPTEHALDLLRALRGVSQETGQLSIVVAGVNATPSESPHLGGDDNPLFGLLTVRYLGPLEPNACQDMIRSVGRKMRIRWEDPATTAITQEVGAHPLLARLAASDVAIRNPERPFRPTKDNATDVLRDFHRRHSAIFEQMVHSLRRHYPDELDFLRVLASGDVELAADVSEDNPEVLNHLAGYGIVDPSSLTITVPVFHRWLRLHE